MSRRDDSVSTVVEEEKHGNTIPIQMQCVLGGARPVAASVPRARGMNGPQLAVGILGSGNTHVFRRLALGNVPTRVEAFPALLFDAQHFLKPWAGYPCLRCAK